MTPLLFIHLLPEFGWRLGDEPVYGPGSVFQGFVRISSGRLEHHRVILIFQASEVVHAYELGPGVIRPGKRKRFFGIQQTLWKEDEEVPETPQLPFTVQLPLVQYPPSIKHEFYECQFKLTAILEDSQTHAKISQTEKTIHYRPFIETCLLKTPLTLSQALSKREGAGIAEVQFTALDYVPGDELSVSIHVSPSTALSKGASVVLKLFQIATVLGTTQDPKQTKLVASSNTPLTSSTITAKLGLDNSLTPSFSYSPLFKLSYLLKVLVQCKKGPLGGIWAVSEATFELVLTVGTLGYGVRSASELQIYSALPDDQQATARFLPKVEYEDTLPVYDPARLPSYSTSI